MGINSMIGYAPLLAGIVVGGLWQVFVLLGIHGMVIAFPWMNVLSGVPDQVMAITAFPCFAQIGVVLAIYLRTKDQKLKKVALPAFFSGVFGVTESAIYGVTLPHIKMFVISCLGAALAGGLCMLMNVGEYSYTVEGIVSFFGMMNPDSPSMVPQLIIMAVSFAVSFAAAFALYRDEQ